VPTCLASYNVCAIRLTRLFEDGEPDFGNDAYSVHVPISIAETPNTYEVPAIQQANGCGELCVDVPAITTNTGYALVVTLCDNDFELFAALSGGSTISTGPNVIGYAEPAAGVIPSPFCVETWQQTRQGDNVGTISGVQQYKVRVWPYVVFQREGVTQENATTPQVWNGTTGANDQIGATGPYGDWPGPVNGIGAEWYSSTLPAPFCGMIALAS